jgi:hypothetical protein
MKDMLNSMGICHILYSVTNIPFFMYLQESYFEQVVTWQPAQSRLIAMKMPEGQGPSGDDPHHQLTTLNAQVESANKETSIAQSDAMETQMSQRKVIGRSRLDWCISSIISS